MDREKIDALRRQILVLCRVSKSCAEIEKATKKTHDKIYNNLIVLEKLKKLGKTTTLAGARNRDHYHTIDDSYARAEYPKQRNRGDSPAVGHFIHRIENFEAQHRDTSKMNRANYRSRGVHIGVSTVYEG